MQQLWGFFWLLLQAYAKEYGKQVEGSVKVNTLTGAPFTIVNMVNKLLDTQYNHSNRMCLYYSTII